MPGGDEQALHRELILGHARSPHRGGLREPFDVEVQHANPTCGDRIRLRVLLRDDVGGRWLADVSYEALGCAISLAGASVMAEQVTGARLADAMARYQRMLDVTSGRAAPDPETDGDLAAFGGVSRFPVRVRCALLGWAAMRDAVTRAGAAYPGPTSHEETR